MRGPIVSDAVYSDSLLIRSSDSSSFTVTSRRFGPAGVLRLQLAEGIVVAVDAAEPGQLAFLDVAMGSRGDLLVGELVGDEAAQYMAATSPMVGAMPRKVERASDSRSFRLGSVPDPGDPAEFVGEVIRLLVIAESSSKSPLVRLVAALEVVRRSHELMQFPNLGELFRSRARVVVRHLRGQTSLVIGEVRELDDAVRRRVVTLIDRGRDGGSDIDVMRQAIESMRSIPISVKIDSGSSTSPGRRKNRVPKIVAIERSEPNWITLKFDVHKRNFWVRVIEGETQQLVSLVPVKLEPRRGNVADVLIPVDHVDSTLAFEVTVSPLPMTDDPVDGHINGVRLGFKAVDMNQRGCQDEARELWLACADQWARLGDLQRSRLALDYARKGITRRYRSLADRVDQSTHFEL